MTTYYHENSVLAPIPDNMHFPLPPCPHPSPYLSRKLNPLAIFFQPPPSTSHEPFPFPLVMSTISNVPPHFYEISADSRPAAFSTHNGTKPKRELPEPRPMPIIRANMGNDIEARADQLLKDFPEAAGRIVNQPDWWGLHDYFDSFDLWVDGPDFCYWVVVAIAQKNQKQACLVETQRQEKARVQTRLAETHRQEQAYLAEERARAAEESARLFEYQQAAIRDVALSWIECHETLVLDNPGISDLTVLFDEAARDDFINMTPDEMNYMKERLSFYRNRLLARIEDQSLAQSHYAPSFGGPHMLGPQVPVPYPAYQYSQGPVMLPLGPFAYGQSGNCMASVGPLAVVGQHSGQREPFPNLAHDPVLVQNNRQKGNSNASQGGRSFYRNSASSKNNRRRPDTTPLGGPYGNAPIQEPIYVLNSSHHTLPQPKVAQRNMSEPIPFAPFQYNQNAGGSNGSPSDYRHVSNNSVNHNSPPDQIPFQSSHRHNSSAATLQTTSILPVVPSKVQTFSNDARVSNNYYEPPIATRVFSRPYRSNAITLGVPVRSTTHDTLTMFYVTRPRDLNNNRTVHISRLSEDMFYSHTIKNMMGECGEVEHIHYLRGNGRAFVTFSDHSSVDRAIQRWNKVSVSGEILEVSVPRAHHRKRSASNANNGGQRGARRLSDRSLEPSFENTQLRSQMREITHHQLGLDTYMQQQDVLNNVANRPKGKGIAYESDSMAHVQQGTTDPDSQVKKENVAPGKHASLVDRYPKQSKKKSRENASTRPTPAVSPSKSLSAADLKDSALPEKIKPAVPKMYCQTQGKQKENPSIKTVDMSKSEAFPEPNVASETVALHVESAPVIRDSASSIVPSGKMDSLPEKLKPAVPKVHHQTHGKKKGNSGANVVNTSRGEASFATDVTSETVTSPVDSASATGDSSLGIMTSGKNDLFDSEKPKPAVPKVHHQTHGKKKGNSGANVVNTSRGEASFATDVTSETVTSPVDSASATGDSSLGIMTSGKNDLFDSEKPKPAVPKVHHQTHGKKKGNSGANVVNTSRGEASFATDITSKPVASPIKSAPVNKDSSFGIVSSSGKASNTIETRVITKSQSTTELPSHPSSKPTAGKTKSRSKQHKKNREVKLEIKTTAEPLTVEPQALVPEIVECLDATEAGISGPRGHSKKNSDISKKNKPSKRDSGHLSAKPLTTEQDSMTVSQVADDKAQVKTVVAPSADLPVAEGSLALESPSSSLGVFDWPNLAPTKSSITDSKLPPALMGSLTKALKDATVSRNTKGKTAVAVPRAFETRPKPTTYELGTETWPFVRSTKPK